MSGHFDDEEGAPWRPVPIPKPEPRPEGVDDRLKREHEERCRRARKLAANKRKR